MGDLRTRGVTPHIAGNGTVPKPGRARKTAIDEATTSHPGYAISQRCRKRIEEVFGWIKAAVGFASVKVRGKPKVDATFNLAVAAYNLIRIPKLLARPATWAKLRRTALNHPNQTAKRPRDKPPNRPARPKY